MHTCYWLERSPLHQLLYSVEQKIGLRKVTGSQREGFHSRVYANTIPSIPTIGERHSRADQGVSDGKEHSW